MARNSLDRKYKDFVNLLMDFIPEDRVYTDELRRLCWGTDAGFYRMVPQVVVRAADEEEVSRILSHAYAMDIPVTFRAAGTSLSGQSISDSVLVVAGKNWEKYSYDPQSGKITLQPGIIGASVNRMLAPYGRKFGPDPASIGSCMVGGIVMNNASGMSCGTHANSDMMLSGIRVILPDGTVLDTSSAESRRDFRLSHPEIIEGIERLRDEVQMDSELSKRIEYKYSIKNVTGLNIYPFIRYTDPFEIIAHLMVGSEGTLAFMSEVTMDTLESAPFTASAMIYFPDIKTAAKAVVAMRKLSISAAELLDKRSLSSVNDKRYVAECMCFQNEGKEISECDLTAVLTQTESTTIDGLNKNIAAIKKALKPFGVEVSFTSDPAEYGKYWAIRSGIFPSVGGMRKEGTTCMIEDVAFHIEDLPEATADLSALLDRHGYDDSCIYGHALAGNFHFIINQSFETPEDTKRYEDMIRDVADMVITKYDGSLKAEHGTGRNMAPFVEFEWGEKAFSVMKRIKELFDPKGILNPGVIFNDDPECFLKNFKAMPVLTPKVGQDEEELKDTYSALNKCIECGFCEVNCLTCGFSLSSRTRIVARREIERLSLTHEDDALLSRLVKDYSYLGEQSCAGDGLCSTSCPMGINVADLTHQLRRESLKPDGRVLKLATKAADDFPKAKKLVRGILNLASFGQSVLGTTGMAKMARGLHNGFGIPLWTPSTPKSYRIPADLPNPEEKLKVVYFPSCINQTMGLPKQGSPVKKPLVEEMTELLHKAGYEVIFPEGMDSLCCGTIWESKGMPELADKKTAELEEALWKASQEGKYPVLCDQSPCLHRMKKKIKRLKLYEPAEFIWEFIRNKVVFTQTKEPVAVHVTCSTKLMGISDKIISLAKLCSSEVIVPEGVGCCGFAGDKGMTHPEVNAYALRKLREGVKDARIGYSNSRTCEIGLATNSGIPYVSIVYLVNSHTEKLADSAE